jgi:hypothetical protein
MTPEEKTLISGLFDRLSQASNQPKDPDAEQLIRGKVSENPAATYLLAQSTLVLQQALANAQNRISDVERQLAEAQSHPAPKQGGFLSGVAGFFGGNQPNTPPPAQRAPVPPPPVQAPPVPVQQQYQPPYQQPPQPQYGYPPPPPQQQAGGGMGGFLSGALTTAAGVAGGALLFRGIEGLLGHNPGPFAGSAMPGGGFLGNPTENITEVTNNYYTEGEQHPDAGQQVDSQSDPDPDPDPAQYASNDDSSVNDPDPDPDPNDFASDDSGFDDGGGSDDNFA